MRRPNAAAYRLLVSGSASSVSVVGFAHSGVKVAIAGAGVLAAGLCMMAAPPLLIAAVSAAASNVASPPSAAALRVIPPALLTAYERAPTCAGLPWQVVAGIGFEESRHATAGGAHLDLATGDVRPPIVGMSLNGAAGTAAIHVPAGGSPWHSDPVWDHATGPMQFITTTWTAWGVDASPSNGTGPASPHNAFDAIATTGAYLCNHRARLDGLDDLRAAIRRYNASDLYVTAVLDKAYLYGMVDGGDLTGSVYPPDNPEAGGPVIAGNVAPVVNYAIANLGDPYVWGAEGPDAFDCSGLTMAAYQQIGIRLPHRSALQVRYGQPINWHTQPIKAGDLLFMRGSIPVQDYGHVGIAISPTQWINAARSGTPVARGPIPTSRLQAVRRLVLT